MKRATALIIITLAMATIFGCGGGSGQVSSGTSTVKITIAGLAREGAHSGVNAQSSVVASIKFTISAPDMDTITRTVQVAGTDTITESFVVPNGSNRHFLAAAFASDNSVLSQGDALADLDGTPKDINIAMGIDISGEWTFTTIGQDGEPETDFITFTQAGNSLTLSGTTVSASLLKSVFNGSGTVIGNSIQLFVASSACGNAINVAFTGTFFADGSLGGTFTNTGGCGNDSGTWQAVRGHIVPPPAQGSVTGTVTDTQTSAPLTGVAIKLFQQGSLITSGATGSNGTYSLTAPAGSGYSIEFSKSGYITKTVDNITIASNTITTIDAALAVPVTAQGTVSGTVKDALTGLPLPGVSVKLSQLGSTISTVTNNQDGTYSITASVGSGYSLEFSKSGYITSTIDNISILANSATTVDAVLTTILSTGQTRIILTWGAEPKDLDSHLTGPIPDSSTRFHIYYADMGSATSSPFAALDVDDTDGFGPETTTIYQQFSGVYRFSVRDFTNGGDGTTSTALSNSGAQVKVYQGNSLVATFNVPTNQGGDVWTVFELNGSTITPINTMTFVPDETTIQSTSGKVILKKTKKKGTGR